MREWVTGHNGSRDVGPVVDGVASLDGFELGCKDGWFDGCIVGSLEELELGCKDS